MKTLGGTVGPKSRELVLFIAHRLGTKERYGATMLNKALYFIDNVYYLKTGKPISDFKYVRQDFGATPDPAQFMPLRDELVNSNEAESLEREFFGRIQKKLMAKREPNLDLFEKEEIAFIDEMLAQISEKSATDLSDFAHRYPAWKAASDKEELPFFTFLLSSKTPNQDDIDWAKSVMAESSLIYQSN